MKRCSSSASRGSSASSSRRPLCFCGIHANLCTSHTKENPDRTFWGCRNWQVLPTILLSLFSLCMLSQSLCSSICPRFVLKLQVAAWVPMFWNWFVLKLQVAAWVPMFWNCKLQHEFPCSEFDLVWMLIYEFASCRMLKSILLVW